VPETAEEIRLTRLESDVSKLKDQVIALIKFQAWFGGGFGVLTVIVLVWLNKHGINFG
jgi:hypothetical protein